MGWVEALGVVAFAVVVLAALVSADYRAHKNDVPPTPILPAPPAKTEGQSMAHWMEGWYRSIEYHDKVQAALREAADKRRLHESDIARRNYDQGYADGVQGKGNRYLDPRMLADMSADEFTVYQRQFDAVPGPITRAGAVHQPWCAKIRLSPDSDCSCYFGAQTNG